MKKDAGWVVEDTEKEVLRVAEICKKQGKIESYDKPERYIKRYKTRTKEPIYGFKSHCYIEVK